MFRAAMCSSSGELIVSIRHLVYVTLYRWRFDVQVWMRLLCSLIQTSTLNGHLYRVTYTRCHIDTINSPDDGHMAARNIYRIEINIHEKELCVKLVIYKDYTEMHGQQNIKGGNLFMVNTKKILPHTYSRMHKKSHLTLNLFIIELLFCDQSLKPELFN
jgi:hypothetical protein